MKKQFIVILLVSFIMAGLTSCLSTDPKFNEDGSPYWTTKTPTSRKYYYGVGSGKLLSTQNSKLRAEAQAKDEIARKVSSIVQSSIVNYTEENQYKLDYFDNFSMQVTNATLRGVEVEEVYKAEDGTFWVLSRYSKKNLKEAYELEAENLKRQIELKKIQAEQELAKAIEAKNNANENMLKEFAINYLKLSNVENSKLLNKIDDAMNELKPAFDKFLEETIEMKQKTFDETNNIFSQYTPSTMLNYLNID